jgi:hypothetical protein
MTDEANKSCAQRIEGHFESTMQRLRAVLALVDRGIGDAGDLDDLGTDDLVALCDELGIEAPVAPEPVLTITDEDIADPEEEWAANLRKAIADYAEDEGVFPEDALESFILGASKRTVWDIQLSTGGPADGFKVEVDNEGSINEISYYFKDWFDGAKRRLFGDNEEVAKQALQYLVCMEE